MSRISIADRIKESSYSVGTGDFILGGAIQGFSTFSSSFSYGDIVYYAINDGTNYEIGSGQYLFSSPNNILRRYPFKTSSGGAIVNFPAGLKEVSVTYPGQKAVFTAANFGSFAAPQSSGVAFWGSDQILNYDSSIVWDATNNRLGINRTSPLYTIDVGGSNDQSFIRASGVIVGASGVNFPQGVVYSGGRQSEPFLRNELDVSTGTNAVFALSGIVGQKILFKTQSATTVLMGPASGASPGYPSFRGLTANDIPDLSSIYVRQTGAYSANSLAIGKADKVIGFDSFLVWDDTNNYLGVNKQTPTKSLDVVGNAEITGDLTVRSGIVLLSGVPSVVTNKLYNNSGQLYFNGAAVGGAASGTYTSWTLADSGGNTEVVTNGIQIIVSGLFGVNPSINASTNILSINGSGLSGVLFNVINSVSGWSKSYTDSLIGTSGYNGWTIADSGNNSELITKGQTVIFSGAGTVSTLYNSTTNVMMVSGAAGAGYSSWTIADSGGNSEAITNGLSITVSGAFGVNPSYNPANNILLVNGSGLSGVLSNFITSISGWSKSYTDSLIATSGYNGWTIADSGGNSELITKGQTVTFSGINGVATAYNPTTNVLSVSGNYTAGSGIIFTGSQIALSGTNVISASGFAATAFIQTSGAFITQNASFVLESGYNGKTILSSGNSQINVTVNNLPLGFGASFIQTGPGAIYYSGVPGINIRNRQGHTRSNGLWSVSSLVHFTPSGFMLMGDTAT